MSSQRLALLSLLFIMVGLVNASPLPEGELTSTQPTPTRQLMPAQTTCLQPALSTKEADWTKKDVIQRRLNPLIGVPVFWSGSDNNVSVVHKAEKCAHKLNGGTIGMMMCEKKNFTMPDSGSPPSGHKLWDDASGYFADDTLADGYVVMGSKYHEDSTWFRIEFRHLQTNTKVKSIIQLNQDTCAEKCYWICKDTKQPCSKLPKCANPGPPPRPSGSNEGEIISDTPTASNEASDVSE